MLVPKCILYGIDTSSIWHVEPVTRLSNENLKSIIDSEFDGGFISSKNVADPIILPHIVTHKSGKKKTIC